MTLDRRRTVRIATAAVALIGAFLVWRVSTGLFPYHSLNHDEAVYLQQAAMLLEGQLTLDPPVDEVMRPWFFVADGDRLYPKYAPVPAAMFAVGKLLGGYRVALVGVAAGNLALVVAVVREVFDRPTGLVAGAFVLASPLFLLDSAVFLPYAPTTLLNLLFAYGYLRADRTGDLRFAGLAGAAVGLAFFARPYTAVLFATPFVVHALWTLAADLEATFLRQATVAVLGLVGVGVALAYNTMLTGSPLVFPFQAFAPLDGIGFGQRRLLGHEVRYTPRLALRANGQVLGLFFSEWVAGGLFGTMLAVGGLVRSLRRRFPPREAVLAGLFFSISAGNVFFWGNFNLLGDIDRAGDGLVAALGPYYHFDLLLPTAAFAGAGAIAAGRALLATLADRSDMDRREAVVAVAVLGVVGAGVLGAVTAGNLDARLEENADVTDTYEAAYEPFEGGPPRNAAVLVPDPYGDWLNHPFQVLRNDPGYDGRTVYAVHDRPFAVADAFPDRRLYRYVYRGAWAPQVGSPEAARLQRVREVTGDGVRLETVVGVPDGAQSVTVRVATDGGQAYFVAETVSDSLALDVSVSDGLVTTAGDLRAVDGGTVDVEGRQDVVVTIFVDYGPGGGFSYRFDLPVDTTDGRVRALTPRVERCRNARACGGAAAHVPGSAPEGVFVRTDLVALEPNG